METPPEEQRIMEGADGEEATPVCLKCFKPVNPLDNYCPNCGGATGNFTHYLPFVSIPWQASVWGQAWRQVRSADVSILGRLFRLVMIVWNVPIMLIGLLFKSNSKAEHGQHEDSNRPADTVD